jgi:serine/threonine-protein kinase RsbW
MTSEAPLQPAAGFVVHLENSLTAIEDGRLALLRYLEPFHPDERLINRLEVVLEELVSNVVRHNATATTVTLEAEYRDEAVSLTIEDNGAAFDPFELTMPARFTTLEEAKLGGLGVPLIRRLTQSVHYQRTGGCNRVSAVVAAN